ncbi:RICIN domain-containing protein [Bifidobacterium callitrichos]|uniref:RICIN domain-containing protein n=1 Tax=Bifidobacterium callitrichos TaxID=762209 RepID=UPI001239C800|nr:RICIN domain-containing protein [Bifidobacterium callitrichos]
MIATLTGALAVVAMMIPMASAQAADVAPIASVVPVADTSADGIQRVAKTHKPQVEQQSFTAAPATAMPAEPSAPTAPTGPNGGTASGSGSEGELGDDAFGNGNSEAGNGDAAAPYSLAAEPRSRSAAPQSGDAGDGSDSASNAPAAPAPAPVPSAPSAPQPQASPQTSRAVTVSADLSGLATVGVTWKQQDMKDADKAPTYQLRYFRNNAWSQWITIPSIDDDFGRIGLSPSYYVGDATKVEAQLIPVAGQTITEAKLITVDSGYSAVGDAQGSAYRNGNKGDKASIDDPYAVGETSAVRSDNAASESDSPRPATAGWSANTPAASGAVSATLTSGKSASASASTTTPTVRTAAAVTATGRIHTREEWWVAGNPAMTWKPKRDGHWKGAIVHHTVDRNDYTQAEVPAMINGIYLFHNTQRGWGDIGYQLIVDRFGGIWEGRDEGVANQIVPASQVEGAQASGFNRDTFGIAMLGSYHLDVAPTDAQIESTAAAIAWEFRALRIPSPFGTFQFHGTQQRVTGHGDASHYIGGDLNHTLCPGQQVWDRMETIRARVLGYMIHPSAMAAVNVPNGTYYINSVAKDSSSIEIPMTANTANTANGSNAATPVYNTADGARTQLHSATGKPNQQFTFTRQPDGSYEIRNVASGKALDVADDRAWNNAEVRQWTPDNTAAQHWFIRDSGSGYYLQSALGDYVLDLSNGRTADGSTAALYSANDSAAQKFGLASADIAIPTNRNVRIESALRANLVLDIYGGSMANGGALQIYGWNGSGAQQYRFRLVGNNVVEIRNVRSGRVIDVPGNSKANGVKLQQYAANGSSAQHWMVRRAGSGGASAPVSFYGVASGKSFDLPGGSQRPGTRVQLYTGNNTVAQQWRIR